MDIVKAAYAYRWVAPIIFVGGLVVIAMGFAVHGKGGADLGRLGMTVVVVAAFRIGYLARTDRGRATYRYLRCSKRTEPVVTLTAGDDK